MNLNLVYDRTAEDVESAKTYIESIKNSIKNGETINFTAQKGYYNYEDINRVQAAANQIDNELAEAGYNSDYVPVSRVWTDTDIMRQSEYEQYLNNIQAIIDCYYTMTDSPSLPTSTEGLTYIGANNIEKILTDIETLIGYMQSSYRKCGTFQSGVNKQRLPLQRSVT